MMVFKKSKASLRYLACAALIAAPLAHASFAHASEDVIAERKAYFKQSGGTLRAMRGQIASGDFEAIAKGADNIAIWAAKMTDYFPEGSGEGKTSARPEIWERFNEFTMLAKSHEEAALALKKAALAQDGAAVGGLAQKLGATCGACHSQFKY